MLASKITERFFKGSDRSVKARKNILAMLFLKGGNILIGLLLVPLTIGYVDSDTYGIWITVSSMVAWMGFLDIGINNGLKNKLTEALAVNDYVLAKKYVSTTYALLLIIFIPLMVILLFVAPVVNWEELLNLRSSDVSGISTAMSIVIAYFCVNFILSTVNIVMLSDQRPAAESLRTFIQQLLTLVVIFLLTKTVKGNLNVLCLALCLCPIAVSALFNFTLFRGRYRQISPSLGSVDFSLAPSLFKLGVMFFVIQIAGVVQYQMSNFLILRYFGATDVTEYNIAVKLFNVPYMFWCIIVVPIWASVTDAITKGDFIWVRDTVYRYLKLFLAFTALSVLILAASGFIYKIWIGGMASVPFEVSFWVMVFNLAMMVSSVFVNVLNGAGILKAQSIACIVSPLVFLGVFYLLKEAGCGVKSVIIASVVANFNGLVIAPIQCAHMFRSKLSRL